MFWDVYVHRHVSGNNNASDDDNRGASNGLAMLIGSVSKGLGPIVASILFTFNYYDSTFPLTITYFFVISTLTRLVLDIA